MPTYVALDIPPGVFKNGTRYQAKGRWWDSNLVRWSEGSTQPIGGWVKVLDSNDTPLDLTDPIRGLLSWRSNAEAPYMAMGTKDKVYGFTGGILTDITPAGWVTGADDAASTKGQYDVGNYDLGLYGQGSDFGTGAVVEANSTAFDSFGEQLIVCAYADGSLWYWDLNVSNNLVLLHAEAPINCTSVVVTPERFVVGLGGQGQVAGLEDSAADGRRVIWCDQENYSQWSPIVAGSQAGDFLLAGGGQLMCGARNRTETLLWTDMNIYTMRYIGGNLIYSFATAGANCGIISRRAKAVVDGRAYWMSHHGFFSYDGFAKPLYSEISDAVFNDMNRYESSKIACWSISEFNEIWWSYPSGNSTENNKVIVYNYVEDHWSGPWDIVRTDGIDRSVFGESIMVDSQGGVYFHESGSEMLDEDDSTPLVPFVESGPFEIGQGDRLMTINRYIPDETTFGDMDATLFAGMSPTDPVEDEASITVGEISDVRLTGRQVRLKLTQNRPGWRLGIPRLEVIERGRR